MRKVYASTLSISEWRRPEAPGFVEGWVEAQRRHIAPSFGAVVTCVSTRDDPYEPYRREFMVSGYYLDDETTIAAPCVRWGRGGDRREGRNNHDGR